MSNEPPIRYTEEKMIRAAKLVAALFGLLLVVVLPLGAFVSDSGILTSTKKKSIGREFPATEGAYYPMQPPPSPSAGKPGSPPIVTPPAETVPSQGNLNRDPNTSFSQPEERVLSLMAFLQRELSALHSRTLTFDGYILPPSILVKDAAGCETRPIIQTGPSGQTFVAYMAATCGSDRYYCIDNQRMGSVTRISPAELETVKRIGRCPLNQVVNSGVTVMPPAALSAAINVDELSTLVLGVSQSVRDYATNCRRSGGVIRSGSGGERLCSVSNYTLSWPMISLCGTSPSDTKWIVFRGDTDTWDITITCTERPGCDGPSNALCTKDGCTFSETCLPK